MPHHLRRFVFAAAALAFAWLPTAATAAGPDVAHFTLANGLEVVVIPDHRTPVVTHMVWYRVGAADETAGQVRPRPFPRTSDVQGHRARTRKGCSRRSSRPSAGRRTPSRRATTPATSSACAREQLKTLMEFEVRPHDRPGAHRRRGEAGARRRARRVQHAGRQQSRRPARRADGSRALSQPSLRPAGHRLASGDREAQPRGRARLLPALLHAQQRDPDRRRRRHRRRGQDARRGDLRQGPAGHRDRRRAFVRRSPCRTRRAPSRWPIRASPSRACSAIIWRRPTRPRRPARPKRSTCSRIFSAAAPTAGSTSRWCVDKGIAVNAGAGYHGTALDYHAAQRLRIAEARHDAAAARGGDRRRASPRSSTRA